MTAANKRSSSTKAPRNNDGQASGDADNSSEPKDGGDATAAATAKGAAKAKNTRMEKTTVCLPIVYGSVAFFLGKKADEYHTHRWTLYLRGPNDEDLSVCVARVVFQLHPSFSQPVRELTTPPFEVTETGWGEFEAQIRIIWKDQTEKATILTHGIKLYPPGVPQAPPTNTKDPVVAEHYDEVVFTDPNETFYRQLMRTSIAPRIQSGEQNVQESFGVYSDADDFQKLVEAQNFLQKDLQSVKERMKITTEELRQVEDALQQVQEAKKASSSSRASSGKTRATSVSGNAAKRAKISH